MTTLTINTFSSLAAAQDHYCAELDAFAGTVRERFAFSPYLDQEYQLTAEQADAFRASGYTTDPVPDTVQCWADASGMAPQAACDDILSQRDAYLAALAAVRRLRLVGKAAIRATLTTRDAQASHDSYRARLDAIAP